MLARLPRAGELRALDVPDAADDALRDQVRALEDAVVVGTQAKDRPKAFLLRQGRRYPGREEWTLAYRRWLTDLRFPDAARHVALQVASASSAPSALSRRYTADAPALRMRMRPGSTIQSRPSTHSDSSTGIAVCRSPSTAARLGLGARNTTIPT
jgi:transposase